MTEWQDDKDDWEDKMTVWQDERMAYFHYFYTAGYGANMPIL